MDREKIWVVSDNSCYAKEYMLQIISKAYQLSQQKEADVEVICIGKREERQMEELFFYGVKKVIFAESRKEDNRIRTQILKEMLTKYAPSLIMFPATRNGKCLASVISTYYESGLTADCIDVSVNEENEYVFTRAALSDSIVARIICVESRFCLCTVKMNVFQPHRMENSHEIVIESYKSHRSIDDMEYELSNIQIIQKEVKTSVVNENWQNANIIFGIGRGAADAKTVELIYKLAEKYHAEVAGTRTVVEDGIIDKSRQIGQSGMNICPNVYVCFGVSGSCQHVVGIKNAKKVIAINKDENAPIVHYADYVIIDDVKNVLNVMLH